VNTVDVTTPVLLFSVRNHHLVLYVVNIPTLEGRMHVDYFGGLYS
jgi:hypothetical protein